MNKFVYASLYYKKSQSAFSIIIREKEKAQDIQVIIIQAKDRLTSSWQFSKLAISGNQNQLTLHNYIHYKKINLFRFIICKDKGKKEFCK